MDAGIDLPPAQPADGRFVEPAGGSERRDERRPHSGPFLTPGADDPGSGFACCHGDTSSEM
jgi:hypothetical protein